MLVYGILDWGAPAYGSDELAVAMGFESMADLRSSREPLIEAIEAGQPLSIFDWTRTLLAAEIVFASRVFGTASEWTSIHAGTDEHWFAVLRRLQVKIPIDRRLLSRSSPK